MVDRLTVRRRGEATVTPPQPWTRSERLVVGGGEVDKARM
jgi:hypothetical protein